MTRWRAEVAPRFVLCSALRRRYGPHGASLCSRCAEAAAPVALPAQPRTTPNSQLRRNA